MASPILLQSKGSIPKYSENDLQLAIDSNRTEDALAILKQADCTTRPLPNGHLPLHYVIRRGKIELATQMFKELHLTTDVKDSQGLTAVDHAMIGGNSKMIALVLGNKLGQALDESLNKFLTLQQTHEMLSVESDTNSLRSGIHFNHLPPLQKAARNGDLVEVKRLVNPKDPNPYDKHGMTPLHHAVLAGKKEVVTWLLTEGGASVDILTRNKLSLLHLASIGGHDELITSLIKTYKMDPNGIDSRGRSPLHYAMTSEDLSISRLLIKSGADPFLVSNTSVSNFSPLHIMLGLASHRSHLRDPLALSELQVLMFFGVVAPWISKICGENEILDTLPMWGSIASFITAYRSLQSFKSKVAFWGSYLVSAAATPAVLARIFITGDTTGARYLLGAVGLFQAWTSYHVGKGAIQGLSSCWKNRHLETFRPICNAVVHSVIGGNAVNRFAGDVRMGIEANRVLNAWDKHMETEGESFGNIDINDSETIEIAPDIFISNGMFQKYSFIESFLKGNTYKPSSGQGEEACGELPTDFHSKSESDRILLLNPKCEEQAKMILRNCIDDSACKKNYRDLALMYHPDKGRETQKDMRNTIITKLTNALNTLKKQE